MHYEFAITVSAIWRVVSAIPGSLPQTVGHSTSTFKCFYSVFSADEATDSWYGEIDNYNWNNQGFSMKTGKEYNLLKQQIPSHFILQLTCSQFYLMSLQRSDSRSPMVSI